MHSRAAQSHHEQRTLPQAVRRATLADLLACVLCLVCFVCVNARAGAKPALAESTGAESRADAKDADREDDEDGNGASVLSHGRTTSGATSSWLRTAIESGSELHATPAFAVVGPALVHAPLPLPVAARCVRSRACVAQIFLSSVRPRGPTTLA